MDSNKIAKNLVALRGEKSRESVAVALGLSLSTLTMYEIGARIPRDENKEKIARYYGKTVDEIFLLNFVTYRDIKKEYTVKAYGGDTDDSNTSQDLYGQASGKKVKGMDSKDGKNKELLNKQLQLLAEKSLNADADTLVNLTDAMCKVYKVLNGDL